MSINDNLMRVRAIVDAFNERDLDGFLSLHDSGMNGFEPPHPKAVNREKLSEWVLGLQAAFSDGRWIVEFAFGGEEVWVGAEFQMTGTHDGPLSTPWETVEATHRSIDVHWAGVYAFTEDSRVWHLYTYFDLCDVLVQIGVGAPILSPPG